MADRVLLRHMEKDYNKVMHTRGIDSMEYIFRACDLGISERPFLGNIDHGRDV